MFPPGPSRIPGEARARSTTDAKKGPAESAGAEASGGCLEYACALEEAGEVSVRGLSSELVPRRSEVEVGLAWAHMVLFLAAAFSTELGGWPQALAQALLSLSVVIFPGVVMALGRDQVEGKDADAVALQVAATGDDVRRLLGVAAVQSGLWFAAVFVAAQLSSVLVALVIGGVGALLPWVWLHASARTVYLPGEPIPLVAVRSLADSLRSLVGRHLTYPRLFLAMMGPGARVLIGLPLFWAFAFYFGIGPLTQLGWGSGGSSLAAWGVVAILAALMAGSGTFVHRAVQRFLHGFGAAWLAGEARRRNLAAAQVAALPPGASA